MDAAGVCVVSSRDDGGGLVVRVGIPLVDVCLEFLGGRCRPDTVLAAAYDLKVFFTVVTGPPDEVGPADVLAFITAHRTGRVGGHGVLRRPPLCTGFRSGFAGNTAQTLYQVIP
jgi:hypothetical protein